MTREEFIAKREADAASSAGRLSSKAEDIHIGDETPMMTKMKNPFEDTPDSIISKRIKVDYTLSTPLVNSTRSADVFKNLRDQDAGVAAEFDSEMGIVLDDGGDVDDDSDGDSTIDSGVKLNLTGHRNVKDLLEDIEEDEDTARRAYSELSEINDTTGDFYYKHDEEDVQVPNSVNNTASTPIKVVKDTQVLASQESVTKPVKEGVLVEASQKLPDTNPIYTQDRLPPTLRVESISQGDDLIWSNHPKQPIVISGSLKSTVTIPSQPLSILTEEEPLESPLTLDSFATPTSLLVADGARKVPARIMSVTKDDKGDTMFTVESDRFSGVLPASCMLAPILIQIGDKVRLLGSNAVQTVTRLEHVEGRELQCIRGYNTLGLSSKGKEVTVPLDDIYLTGRLYANYKFRVFDDKEVFGKFIEQALVPSQVEPTGDDWFASALFVVTSNKKETDVSAMIKFLKDHGAVVLDKDGFETYIKVTKSGVKLDESLRTKTFAALLSYRHIRTFKYLQALSLGWPILTLQFVNDCLKDEELARDWRQQWQNYLLPAGVSSYRSCTLGLNIFEFVERWKAGQSLYDQVGLCQHVFEGKSILVSKSNVITDDDLLFLLKMMGFQKVVFRGKGSYDYVYSTKSDWEWLVQCVIARFAFPKGKTV